MQPELEQIKKIRLRKQYKDGTLTAQADLISHIDQSLSIRFQTSSRTYLKQTHDVNDIRCILSALLFQLSPIQPQRHGYKQYNCQTDQDLVIDDIPQGQKGFFVVTNGHKKCVIEIFPKQSYQPEEIPPLNAEDEGLGPTSQQQKQKVEYELTKSLKERLLQKQQPSHSQNVSNLQFQQLNNLFLSDKFIKQQSMEKLQEAAKKLVTIKDKKGLSKYCSQGLNIYLKVLNRSFDENPVTLTNILKSLIQMSEYNGFDKDRWNQFKKRIKEEYDKENEDKKFSYLKEQQFYKNEKFLEEFSQPRNFIKLFLFMYTGKCLHQQLNSKMAQFQYPFSLRLTRLVMDGVGAMINGQKKNVKFVGENILYRGLQTRSFMEEKKHYHFSAFTSTSKEEWVAEGFMSDVEIQNSELLVLKEINNQSFKDWVMDLGWEDFQGFGYFNSQEQEIIIFPGFEFLVMISTKIPNSYFKTQIQQRPLRY